jgi:hypothetical protein
VTILHGVKMAFGPDDESAFYETQEKLLGQFGAWIQRNHGADNDDAVQHVELLLDWKYNYDDGDLATWTLPSLDEFLLGWFPRKVTMPPEFAEKIPASVGLWCTFLAADSLLSTSSSSLKSIDAHLRQIQAPFRRAFADTSRHGMAKSLFGSIAEMGLELDPDNPDSISNAMSAFNNLSYEERSRILGLDSPDSFPGASFGSSMGARQDRSMESWYQLIDGLELPPAPEIGKALHNELALQSPVLAQFDQITDFCERPRKLTKTNRLSVNDAVTLAERLGTDSNYRSIAKVRSAGDLSQLSFRIEWARKAGALRVLKGALHPTASWQKKTSSQKHQRAVDVLFESGPLLLSEQGRWFHLRIRDFLDAGLPALLCWFSVMGGIPIPLVDILDTVQAVVDEGLGEPTGFPEGLWQRHTTAAFLELILIFELAGLGECLQADPTDSADSNDSAQFFETASTVPESGFGERSYRRVPISTLLNPPRPPLTPNIVATLPHPPEEPVLEKSLLFRLTDLGRVCVVPFLGTRGFEVPVVGLLANGPLEDLFGNLSSWHRLRIEAEFDAWIKANGVERATVELVAIGHATQDIAVRVALVELSDRLGENAEAVIRALAPTKASGQALAWLITNEFELATDDNVKLAMVAGFEQLSLYCTGEPDDDEYLLGLITNIFERIPFDEFFTVLWHITEPWAGDVLAAIGRMYPDKAVAKAARKAVVQQQTFMATNRKR